MKKNGWSATKKECSIDAEGNIKVDKVTYEKNRKELIPSEKKEVIDLVIRTVGSLSIFIPLLLLYLQRQNEIKLEHDKSVSELFSSVATDMQIILNNSIDDKEFTTANGNLLFKYSPKIRLLKDDSLTSIYSNIIAFTKNARYLKQIELATDSAITRSGYEFLVYGPESGKDQPPDQLKMFISKDSLLREIKKRGQYAYDVQTYTYGYEKFAEKNGLKEWSKPSIRYLADSLNNLAFIAENEFLAFQDYLTESTGWFNKEYLDKHITGRSISQLSVSIKQLSQILELNADQMERYRVLLEKRMLQIL